MKKKIFGLLSALVLLLALAGCGTSVAVSTLVPAEISLGKGDTIAVAQPSVNFGKFIFNNKIKGDPYPSKLQKYLNGVSSSTYSKLTEYVGKQISDGLSGGLFTVLDSETTNSYAKIAASSGHTVRDVMLANGVDFVLSTEITDATYNSYVTSSEVVSEEKTYTVYYLNQYATFTCVCMVQSVEDMSIRDVYSFSGRYPEFGTATVTEIARVSHDEDGKLETISSIMLDDALDMLKDASSDLKNAIRNRLLPHYSTSYLKLKKDDTKDKVLSNAYKLAEDGNYEEALTLFMNNYKATGYDVAGYNAAAICYALGRMDSAKEIANDVFAKTGMADAVSLRQKVENAEKSAQDALNQIQGIGKNGSTELIGF